MPTTNDADRYDELTRRSNQDKENQLNCIRNAIGIALMTSAIITIIYLIVR